MRQTQTPSWHQPNKLTNGGLTNSGPQLRLQIHKLFNILAAYPEHSLDGLIIFI
jgi:hypothetical protein